jgi:hypothetical protein
MKRHKAEPDELRGWKRISEFLGMPRSTAHRWAKSGMPVRRSGRNVVASPEELNRWLDRENGTNPAVHVVTPQEDLVADLSRSVLKLRHRSKFRS